MNELIEFLNEIIYQFAWAWFFGTLIFYGIFRMQFKEKQKLRNFILLRGYRPDFDFIEEERLEIYEGISIKKQIHKKIIYIEDNSTKLGLEFKDDGLVYYLFKDSIEIAISYGLDVILFKINELLDQNKNDN